MDNNLTCSTFLSATSSEKADDAVEAALLALADFKNPHNPGTSGVAYLPNILKELFGGGNALAEESTEWRRRRYCWWHSYCSKFTY